MLLSDSQISVRPLCSDLLFKAIECIFVTCLTKCVKWLVGVKPSPCSSIFICIIFLMLLFISRSFMEFLAMA